MHQDLGPTSRDSSCEDGGGVLARWRWWPAVFGGQHASFYVHTDDDGVRKSSGGVRIASKIRIKERP